MFIRMLRAGSLADILRPVDGLIDRLSAGSQTLAPLAASRTASPATFEPIGASVAADRNAEVRAGLAAAVQMQIEMQRPSRIASAALDPAIGAELQPGASDNRELGLTKAVAREVMARCGEQKAAKAIAAVRTLKSGGALTLGRSSRSTREPSVLASVPRR